MTLCIYLLALAFASPAVASDLGVSPLATSVEVRYAPFASTISLQLHDPHVQALSVQQDGATFSTFAIPGEGTTYERNQPLLPSVSRFVVVPPTAGLALDLDLPEPTRIQASAPPALCNDPTIDASTQPLNGIYPSVAAEMSEPMVIRGVRVVKVTIYPVQYDSRTGEYLLNEHIQADLRFTDAAPVNPVLYPTRRHRSREFKKFINALAVNGCEVGRDDPDDVQEYFGHYLVVAHQSALAWQIPFIEWRRKAGYRMDILSLTANEAREPATVQNMIQDRYNAYLEAGEDPFDQILLVGDRSDYQRHRPAAQNVLEAEVGVTTFRNGPAHADYKYALLEGDDEYPDVGFSRLPSGSAAPAQLAIGRTLAYEMTPRMQNPEWFSRGLVYSQHWGNTQESAWHISIASNVRWGEEALHRLGFTDVTTYENLEWDQNGARVGPVIRDALNEGCNVMIGRAENYYWRDNFNGVNNNTVFPINVCISGHGEGVAWNMFRTGNANALRGPVASTFVWGDPPTAPSSYTWLQLVNSLFCEDLTLGWSRVYANISIEKYFPNMTVGGARLYSFSKTDLDVQGDPGIQPWIGVPRQLTVTAPDTLTVDSRRVDVHVYDNNANTDVIGAQVSLYAPGAIPLDNAANYARWNEILTKTAITDAEGMAHFVLSEGENFVNSTAVYLTLTGRDIVPVLRTARVVTNQTRVVELTGWSLSEVEGNGDAEVNPAEVYDLSLRAKNLWRGDTITDVHGVVTSSSPFVTVEDNDIAFGDISAESEADGDRSVRIRIHPAAADGASRPATMPQIFITFYTEGDEWNSAFKLPVVAPHFRLRAIFPRDTIGFEATEIDFDLNNVGGQDAPSMNAQLVSLDDGIAVLTETATYNPIDLNSHSRLDGEPFTATGTRVAIPGSKLPLLLILSAADGSGFVDTVQVELTVGTPRSSSPLGPDKAGYACFDDTDADWDNAPTYEWIEINPEADEADFNGTRLNFRGNSPENIGEVIVTPLGFETRFYGDDFDTISIALNGFIAMGNQPRCVNLQNWPMDQAIGGGMGMVAPLWDDLRLGQGSGVYVYDDQQQGRKIIEWYRMRNAAGNVEQTFQVVLYDRQSWPTPNGDQPILFQYKNFTSNNNVRNGDVAWENNTPFASVGISSPDGTTGINYCFNNTYPRAAAPLQNRRALLFAHPASSNSRSLRLRTGWNVVSLNIALADSDVTVVTRPLVESGAMTLIKDGHGRFYRSADGFNQIPYWDISSGYQICMVRDTVLTLTGEPISPDAPITLDEGWNLISYYPRRPSDPVVATTGIRDELLVLKDGYGSFYLPRYEYSSLATLSEGKGYFFKVSSPTELIYNEARDGSDAIRQSPVPAPQHYVVTTGQPGSDMSLLIIGTAELACWEAGVYAGSILVGGGVFDDRGCCGVAVWSTTANRDLEGATLRVVLWSGVEERSATIQWVEGDGKLEAGGVSVGKVFPSETLTSALPTAVVLNPVCPNPFNARATVRFGLSDAGSAKLTLFNLCGCEVVTLASGHFDAGWHTVALDASDLPTGLYLVRLDAGGTTSSTKAVIVK